MNPLALGSLVFGLVLVSSACDGPGGGRSTTTLATCNNGTLDQGELCDGALVGANTCQSAGYDFGVLVCNRSCTNYDYSGCSGGNVEPDTTDDTTTSGPSDTTSTETSGANRAPNIISLNANVSALNADDMLIVTAVVTDPDGIDDLIGGTLLAENGASYGAFATSAAEGSYSIQLTWAALAQVTAVDAPPAGKPVTFRAEFFDTAGAKSDKTLSVTFRCDTGSPAGLCDSECTYLTEDPWNCGSCDHVCDDVSAESTYCVASTCASNLEFDPQRFIDGATCDVLCRELGKSCPWGADVMAGNLGTPSDASVPLSCKQTYSGEAPYEAKCLCAAGTGVPIDPPPTTVTIKSIQESAASLDCSASGDNAQGGPVTIEGVVTVGRFQVNSSLSGVFVSDGSQDKYSAIFVRFPNSESWAFTPGQKVRVTGTHYEYYCMTQLAATAMVAIGTGTVPAPRTIAKFPADGDFEGWESVTIKIDTVLVGAANQFGDVQIDSEMVMDDFILGSAFEVPDQGVTLPSVRGVMTYNFNLYRISPRSLDDY